jgi:hypothetical protein
MGEKEKLARVLAEALVAIVEHAPDWLEALRANPESARAEAG